MSVLETFSLKGKKVLVSGGAAGYGVPVSEAVAEAGATTIIADIAASHAPKEPVQVVKDLRAAGCDAHSYYLDLGDEESINKLHEQVTKDFGPMDVLINNAVARPMRTYKDPLSNWRKSMDVNATGVMHITRLFSEGMVEQGRGSIINTASIYGMVGPTVWFYEGMPGDDHYPPDYWFTKGGLINLTRYFAAVLGKDNIRVNAISPGGLGSKKAPEPFLSRYCQNTFLGRMAAPEDIKGAIVFLASDASSYITGINLAVDAGFTAH